MNYLNNIMNILSYPVFASSVIGSYLTGTFMFIVGEVQPTFGDIVSFEKIGVVGVLAYGIYIFKKNSEQNQNKIEELQKQRIAQMQEEIEDLKKTNQAALIRNEELLKQLLNNKN